jgi:N utilization substance protein B
MKRRRAREYALQILYQFDLTGINPDREKLKDFWKEHPASEEIKKFTEETVMGTIQHLREIDEIISSVSEHWSVERMAVVDRNILRFATYELLYRNDIPAAVTINEAIEISKKYSDKESPAFINGILDRITKKIQKRVH